ncbi:hypothetical protein PGT21_009933 [Puccinia graminis f. sp. tritici]|uniref:Uncharacterized protein n=1 Tax=Puccinia graminis f. sp. tritici TaxID=56615 RepID=A0A5B0MB00_PUCGR|nr:hypothetical protein PGT21_009933 [Puccinia graminis f. sp. tritici]
MSPVPWSSGLKFAVYTWKLAAKATSRQHLRVSQSQRACTASPSNARIPPSEARASREWRSTPAKATRPSEARDFDKPTAQLGLGWRGIICRDPKVGPTRAEADDGCVSGFSSVSCYGHAHHMSQREAHITSWADSGIRHLPLLALPLFWAGSDK